LRLALLMCTIFTTGYPSSPGCAAQLSIRRAITLYCPCSQQWVALNVLHHTLGQQEPFWLGVNLFHEMLILLKLVCNRGTHSLSANGARQLLAALLLSVFTTQACTSHAIACDCTNTHTTPLSPLLVCTSPHISAGAAAEAASPCDSRRDS
jgi:hypothetical protein